MSMHDPIADLLTRVRNAQTAGHTSVSMPSSVKKKALCQMLQDEGYITGFKISADAKPILDVDLKYHNGNAVIEEIDRVSRPGLRIYRAHDNLPTVRGGLGIAVISTNKGLMTDSSARAAKLGGEVLCTVF